jgi:rhamnogalacturonyl hydrolase YesR
LNWLEKQKVPTPHGSGWGLQFNWQSEAFVPQNTPCVTITALAATAFYEAYLITQNEHYLSILREAANFVIKDLFKTVRYGAQVFSYSISDKRIVINANSYAALILLYCTSISSEPEMRTLLDGLIEYILKEQNEDGSWFYHDKQQVPLERNFIDSFHSCFILENLFTIWEKTGDAQVFQAIKKGYEYIVHNNLDNRHIVKLYNKYPYIHGIVVDIRSCAEAITCFARLSDVFADALIHAKEIALKTINTMQNADGSFAFRRYWWGINRMPYMRWGQAPMFKGLCILGSFLQKLKEQELVQIEE